ERRERERVELAANPKPANWNEYGGWADGPQRAATGHFRTEKYNGKWYLVDPAGRLFFSVGVNEVHDTHATAISQRIQLFPPLPTVSPDPGGIYSRLDSTHSSSYLAGAGAQCFSFLRYNLLQKHGPNWRDRFATLTLQRLRSWGFNVLVNHGNPSYYQNLRFAYALIFESAFPVTIPGTGITWGPFPDVYDDRFSDTLSKKLDGWSPFAFSKNDPWCIGIFVDNELPWADVESRDNELGLGALSAAATQPAKIAFLKQLQDKYPSVASLNKAWDTAFTSWDQMLTTSVKLTPAQINNARQDLSLFFEQAADTYFSKVQAVMRAQAPNKLYLGTRISRMSGRAIRAASRYCDVISLNFYGRSPLQLLNQTLPDNFTFRDCIGDKPILLSEFSFCALDTGLIYNSGIECLDEEDRAQRFQRFIYDALMESNVVGANYFQYVDQIVTGRSYDGEARITGLIDNTDRPHRHFVATARQLSDAMYAIRSGSDPRLPPLLPSRPDTVSQSSTSPRILARPQGNGQVDLTVQSPPAAAVRYEWSIASAPVGSKPGTITGTAQTATAVQYTSGLYQYQVRFRGVGDSLMGAPMLSDPVDVKITTDLVPISVSPLHARTGDLVSFTAVLQNIGSDALQGQTAATFELVPKAEGARIPLGYGVKVTTLGAGDTLTVPATQGGSLSNGKWVAVKGEYLLRVIADDIGRLPESNKANNVLTVDFHVTD
ncbi:MAG: hypothetical protein KIT22_12640, partial [Verrucomicrobiae bacterium]|nr:hypothetical protein [Verrucomicrobiae bacterium]